MKQKGIYIDSLIVFLLLCISGNPYICYWNLAPVLLLCFCGIIFFKRKDFSVLDYWEFVRKYLLAFAFLFIAQSICCEGISIATQVNYLIKIVSASLIFFYYRERFRELYFSIMYFLAIISLVGFAFVVLGGEIPNVLGTGFSKSSSIHTVFIYNYDTEFNFGRNSGMFWEPGAFACFLLLVPMFFVNNLELFVRNNKWKILIMAIALVTTFSTTGYLVLSFYILLYFRNKNKIIGLMAVILVLSFILSTDVVQMKFEKDLSTIEGLSLGQKTWYDGYNSANRLGSIFFLVDIIKDHPFVGNGLNPEALYVNNKYLLLEENLGIGNGFFMYIANLGIIGLIIYFVGIWKRWESFGYKRIWVMAILTLLLQGEPLLMYPLFIGLPFFRLNGNSMKITTNLMTIKK